MVLKMKVLIISHNVISESTNMGKTLKTYFSDWNDNEIAQFYIHSEIPTETICKNYYRVTDKDIIKSIFSRKSGKVFFEKDIVVGRQSFEINDDLSANIYQKGRKRTPFIYFARNILWDLGKWKTKQLYKWIDSFNPDVVFFASGDYSFLYKVALEIAKYKNIPLIVSCVDDYYINNGNKESVIGKYVYKTFMKEVIKVMNYCSGIVTICEKMSEDYSKLFDCPTYDLKTPSTFDEPLHYSKKNTISYIGNLDCDRYKSLIVLGNAIKNLDCEKYPTHIDVYSSEKNEEILNHITKENGLSFCGFINSEKVKQVIGESKAILHVESFDEKMQKRVMYSVSTKIADSLISGTPLIAFGPKGIASIDYLEQERAAYCITSEKDIEEKIVSFFDNEQLQKEIIKSSVALAKVKHNGVQNRIKLKKILESVYKLK